ncbi:hypothetical protein [Streptomyces sp. WAC 01325]|uniref:hypothetical protein n=1 Tax=Streptomyces sp. WAC 01325 TaxID=2203202 RepID=UPI000F8859E9|nr:hypothetical protein [Streptomyces sp. WAC 01325]
MSTPIPPPPTWSPEMNRTRADEVRNRVQNRPDDVSEEDFELIREYITQDKLYGLARTVQNRLGGVFWAPVRGDDLHKVILRNKDATTWLNEGSLSNSSEKIVGEKRIADCIKNVPPSMSAENFELARAYIVADKRYGSEPSAQATLNGERWSALRENELREVIHANPPVAEWFNRELLPCSREKIAREKSITNAIIKPRGMTDANFRLACDYIVADKLHGNEPGTQAMLKGGRWAAATSDIRKVIRKNKQAADWFNDGKLPNCQKKIYASPPSFGDVALMHPVENSQVSSNPQNPTPGSSLPAPARLKSKQQSTGKGPAQ